MAKSLTGSRFLGLAVMMAAGLHQFAIVAGGDEGSEPGAPADD